MLLKSLVRVTFSKGHLIPRARRKEAKVMVKIRKPQPGKAVGSVDLQVWHVSAMIVSAAYLNTAINAHPGMWQRLPLTEMESH
jgi:hypothetical protein